MKEVVWWNGAVVPRSSAVVAVTSETALRGVNAFEGMRAYWRAPDRRFALVSLEGHLHRLRTTLWLLRLPAQHLVDPLRDALEDVVLASEASQHLYLRPTIYLEVGSYTDDPARCTFGSFISCAPAPESSPIACAISSHERVASSAFPTRAKSGAMYSMFRLARLEAASAGCDEAILLNSRGHVAETGGASVFIVKDGRVATPRVDDGILDSITRRYAIRIMNERLDTPCDERSISRTELMDADEVFLTGTMDEIRIVHRLDGSSSALGQDTGSRVRGEYRSMCLGEAPPLDDDMFTEVFAR